MGDKPSWRDMDRRRDQSAHRQGERPKGRPQARTESATAAYKRTLDAFFDKGVVPNSLKGKLENAGVEVGDAGPRTKLLRAVREAKDGRPLNKAIDALLAEFEMPDEPELLLRFLRHPKDKVLGQVLDKLAAHLDTGMPLPKKERFVEPLKGLEFTSFDPRVQAKAMRLVGRLKS